MRAFGVREKSSTARPSSAPLASGSVHRIQNVAPLAIESKTFYISPNAGPSQLAGEQCSPYFFAASWQNDVIHEAPGKFASVTSPLL